MFDIISFDEKSRWDDCVMSFPDYDVYYLNGYQAAFKLHGDGEPVLIYYKADNGFEGCCVFFMRDIAHEEWTAGQIASGTVYDLTTPYGYGGWIFKGESTADSLNSFYSEYFEYMKSKGIVCAFTRWCPWSANQETLRGYSNVIDLGNTIYIDTESEEVIFQNIKSKDRATIRKAPKMGVEIKHSDDPGLIDDFMKIYDSTMEKDNADPYYYFDRKFYESIFRDLKGNVEMFYAVYEGEIIAMSLMLFCNGHVHYHLSGSVFEYRRLNATNRILYETAVYASKRGYKLMHLGGGVGSGEDPLYRFKKSFNKNGAVQFSISKDCFDKGMYDKLVDMRGDVAPDCSFFPAYRS